MPHPAAVAVRPRSRDVARKPGGAMGKPAVFTRHRGLTSGMRSLLRLAAVIAVVVPLGTTARAQDADADCAEDAVDCCPDTVNPRQDDCDADGTCDACQPGDADGDGVDGPADNCPCSPNVDQDDFDGDGIGDACDACLVWPDACDPDADVDTV